MYGAKRDAIAFILAAALFAAAAVFRFALIGYSFMAYTLAGIGCLVLFFWLTRRRGDGTKKLRRFVAAVVIICVLAFAAVELPIISASRGAEDDDAPYLIVLGAGLNGTAPSLSLANRLDAAVEYLREHPGAKAIVTGGQGEGEEITEAEAMRVWLEARGIEPERIIKEEKAVSTRENIKFSLELIRERGGDPGGEVAIVSSEYHLYRACRMAESLGAEPLGVPARTTYPVLRLNYFIREGFAVVYMWIFDN